jgi:hypothetical protein
MADEERQRAVQELRSKTREHAEMESRYALPQTKCCKSSAFMFIDLIHILGSLLQRKCAQGDYEDS